MVAMEPLQQRASARLSRVVDGWLTLLPDAARSWGRLEQFLELIEGVGYMGDRERDLLVNRRMVCRLCDFFLQASLLQVCLLFFILCFFFLFFLSCPADFLS